MKFGQEFVSEDIGAGTLRGTTPPQPPFHPADKVMEGMGMSGMFILIACIASVLLDASLPLYFVAVWPLYCTFLSNVYSLSNANMF